MKKIVLKTSCILLSASSLFASDTPTGFFTDTEAFQHTHTFRDQGKEFDFIQGDSQCMTNTSPEDIFAKENSSRHTPSPQDITQEEALKKIGSLIEKLKIILQEKQELLNQENVDQVRNEFKKSAKKYQEAKERIENAQKYYSLLQRKKIIQTELGIGVIEELIHTAKMRIEKLSEQLQKETSQFGNRSHNNNITRIEDRIKDEKQNIRENKEQIEILQEIIENSDEETRDLIKRDAKKDEVIIQEYDQILEGYQKRLDKITSTEAEIDQIKRMIEKDV